MVVVIREEEAEKIIKARNIKRRIRELDRQIAELQREKAHLLKEYADLGISIE